jgi:hypothetical protein
MEFTVHLGCICVLIFGFIAIMIEDKWAEKDEQEVLVVTDNGDEDEEDGSEEK